MTRMTRTLPTLFLATCLGAAARPQESRDPLAGELTALLLEQVQGDAAAAEAEVGRALAALASAPNATQAQQRPRLLLRRALLRERLGRAAEARADLGLLVSEPAPVGPWARARLGQGADSRPTDVAAPLARLVAGLDYDDSQPMVSRAENELRSLGALAVPALLARLDTLEVFGLRRALALLADYPDMGVVPAFERLLAQRDQPVRQLTAAEALTRLPLATRKPLAVRLLEQSQISALRLAALSALVEDPSERGRLATECTRRELNDARAQTRLAGLLEWRPLPGNAEVLRWLEGLALGADATVGKAALAAFAANVGDEGEPVVLALLDRIPKDYRARGVFDHLRRRNSAAWPRVRVRELTASTDDVSSAIRALRADGIQPTSAELVRMLELQPASAQPAREVFSYALNTLAERKDAAGVPVAVARLVTVEDPFALAMYLSIVAPAELESRLAALLGRSLPSHVTQMLFRVARDRGIQAAVPAAIEFLLRRGVDGGQIPFDDAAELVAQHSGPEHLAGILDLGRARQIGVLVQAACRALRRWFNPACVGPALARLPELAKDTRAAVVAATYRCAAPADVPALVNALERVLSETTNEDRLPIAGTLIATLGRIGSTAAVARLQELLTHADSTVQASAWQALRENPTVDHKAVLAAFLPRPEATRCLPVLLAEPMVAADETLRRAALLRLREARENAQGDELQGFLGRLPAAERVAFATECLDAVNQGPGSLGTLACSALAAVGELRDEALIPVLAKGLRSRQSGVRAVAITQLGATFSRQALPFLLEAMKDEVQENADLAMKYTERFAKYFDYKRQVEEMLKQPGK